MFFLLSSVLILSLSIYMGILQVADFQVHWLGTITSYPMQ